MNMMELLKKMQETCMKLFIRKLKDSIYKKATLRCRRNTGK